jgi:hypothetical protein
VLKQISEAWEQAKTQLAQLRAAVEKTSALAQAKATSDVLARDRDRALRDFGEVVWAQVKAGRLQLPAGLTPAMKAMQEVEQRADKHKQDITALIQEGGEAVDRIKAKPNRSHKSAVAAKGKKR